MAENNVNIQMRLVSVNEVSFMMAPAIITDDVKPESIQLGFSNQVRPDIEHDRIAVVFGIRYELNGDRALECVYRFEFEVKELAQFVKIHDDNHVTITHIMPHLLSVAVGTMRGILVAKTAGTNLSKFPLPMIDPNRLMMFLSGSQK